MENGSLRLPHFRLKTPDGDISVDMDMPLSLTDSIDPGKMRLRLQAQLGRQTLLPFLGDLPQDVRRQWPDKPLMVSGLLRGNLQRMEMQDVSIEMPGALRATATGFAANLNDPQHLAADLQFKTQTGNLQFLMAMLPRDMRQNYRLPPLTAQGHVTAHGEQYTADITAREGTGIIKAKGAFHAGIMRYNADLSIHDLKVNYGGIEAVKGISFDVPESSIITLIGSNGAGKSSTLRTIAGLVKPSGGKITFRGDDITGLDPTSIVKRGITLVPEGRKIFPDLTVLENLKMGAYLRNDDISGDIQWVYDLFPRLKERSWQAGGTLSGGEQQMLAVGRALMSRPKMIMMDEPSLGLAPLIVKGIFEIIREINNQGVTVLLIEQNANMALKTADFAYVLETGKITLSGPGSELLVNEDVKKAYLGT